jgi:DNA-directed RNA polymerase specialized sigma24 family protein
MAQHDDDGSGSRSFEESLLAAFPLLCQRLTRRFGDPQLAEEVSWDCLTQAYEVWRADPHFFERRDLTAWSSQRAAWRALDRLRERGRFAPLAEEHAGDEDGEGLGAPLADPADEEAARRLLRDRQLTWDSLRQLGPDDREVLEGYYYEGLTDQEIGARRYGPEGSAQARGLRVWRRRKKAQERLKTLLVENGIDPSDYAPLAVQAV